jgi:uncharacterized membrane protein HdeD (DUF308 family)
MNNSNSQQQIVYPVAFVSYIAIEGLLLTVLGMLCFYIDQQINYSHDYLLLAAIIIAAALCRGISVYLITTLFSKSLVFASITPLIEFIFAIFLVTHPLEVLTHLQRFSGYFLILVGLLRFFEAYWMKIEGVMSFCYAIGLLLIVNGVLIFLDWPSAGLWSPWLVIGIELITYSVLHFWFVFFVRSKLDFGTSKT